jgi:excisionase family DNA binding protein
VPRGKRFASVQDGAHYSGLSEKTLRRYISDGRLTGYRLGVRLLRIDLNELDQLFKPIPNAGGGTDAA